MEASPTLHYKYRGVQMSYFDILCVTLIVVCTITFFAVVYYYDKATRDLKKGGK